MNRLPYRRSSAAAVVVALSLCTGAASAQDVEVPWNDALPPGTEAHAQRALDESSRHGEWVDIELPGGGRLNTWVVYPERADKAGVVLVIHDIRGMGEWIRAVGDQLAQDGYIAVVPDFLSGKGPGGGGTASLGREVRQAIRDLSDDEVDARLNAAMAYGQKLPAANGRTAVLGFCWGGSRSWGYALAQPKLDGAVVFYGSMPGATDTTAPDDRVAAIGAPVLGLYGGNDARVNATLPPTIAAMMRHAKPFEFHSFEGAGHGFTRSQAGAGGSNLTAVTHAWPLVLGFLGRHLE